MPLKTLYILLGIAVPICAQLSGNRFERLTIDQGLSQSTCGAIVQDKLGFMWFGTQDGLNRYDGFSFKVYRTLQKQSNGLTNNFVNTLLVDSKGNLWAGTRFGLNLYDRHTDRFISFIHHPNDSTSLSSNDIFCLYEDTSGTFWVGTISGLNRFRWEDSSFTRYEYIPNSARGLNDGRVNSIVEDNRGNLWIATDKGGLNKFDPTKGTFVHYMHDPKNPAGISGNTIGDVVIDSHGELWLGVIDKGIDRFDPVTAECLHYPINGVPTGDIRKLYLYNDSTILVGTDGGGLQIFDCVTGTYTILKNIPGDPNSLGSNTVYALYKDNTGALWIGTAAGGVNKYDPRQKNFNYFQNNPKDKNSLNNNYVISILKDLQKKIWIGTREGGLNVYDSRTEKFKVYQSDPKNRRSIPSNLVTALFEDSKGTIWVGTLQGLSRFNPGTDDFENFRNNSNNLSSISGNFVTSIAEDGRGNLWVGILNSGLNKMERSTGRFTSWKHNKNDTTSIGDNFISSVYPDRNGHVWVGTTTKGLNRLDTATGKFTEYQPVINDSTSLSNNSITSLLQDRKGTMWIGTGNGLNRYNPDGTFTVFTTNDGFANNVINAMLEDSRGSLWLSTNKGITRFDPERRTAVNYFSSDGLPVGEFTFGTPWKTKEGEMFFGNVLGAVYFHPDSIKTNTFVPPVVFTEFQIFYSPAQLGRDISEMNTVTLDYTENIFSFNFSALNYLQPAKNQYAYKLKGFVDDWIQLGNKHSVTFTHLDPGEYTLLVKGSNNDGVWNETPASMQIVILPPWWGTWWFRAIIILAFLTSGPIVYYRRVTGLKRTQTVQREYSRKLIESQEAERKRIANELHDSLGQNLLVIKNKLLLNQQEKSIATERLNDVSDLVSNTIEEVRNISHNLRPHQLDQLGITKTLRSIVRQMSESTSIEFSSEVQDIDGALSSEQEISLFRIVQESFNNIIKHSGSTRVNLNITRSRNLISMTIADNGKGISSSVGFGISGMQERAKMFGWKLSIESRSNQGTELSLVIQSNTV